MDIEENYALNFLFFGSAFLFVCFVCEWLLPYLKKKTKIKIKIYHHNIFYKIIFVCCLILQIFFIMFHIFFNKTEINRTLRDKESIGALWAHQTYDAYYKITSESIMERIMNFETKYNVRIRTHKLVIVIPLLCNIEGIFTQKDPLIQEFGTLEVIEDDAGGNINRQFKHPVYKICSNQDVYIVAEFSQPVSALFRSQFILEKEKFVYIRDCYIKTLKLLLQGSPCLLVIYDDINASESLSSCILATIEKEDKRTHCIV